MRFYLISFILSVGLARQHGYRTVLVTDDKGVEILVDYLGLSFDEVETHLNALDSTDPVFWNSGKVLAYGLQAEPFIHIDNDVYLWEPLPRNLLRARLVAQNPEFINEHLDYYRPTELEHAIARVRDAQLPKEWRWCRALLHGHQRGYNTGIYGGQDNDFIRYCSGLFFDIVHHPGVADLKKNISNPFQHAGMLEMLLPGVCVDYHQGRPGSPFSHIDVTTLFADPEEAYVAGDTVGYTHLLGASKRNPVLLRKLSARVGQEFPKQYMRCEEYCSEE